LIVWIGAFINNLIKRRSMPQNEIFLFIWGIGSIVLLSLSATKRAIYMAPVLPAFALMCIPTLATDSHQKWFRGYFFVWGVLCAILLAVCTFIPFAAGHLPHKIPPEALVFFQTFGLRNIVSGVGLIFCLYMLFRFLKGETDIGHIILVSALLYIGLFAVPAKAVDTIKSMRSDIQSFTDRISPEVRPHVAGYNFNETMLGCFYYYSDWAVPQITDDTRINRIISGTDAQYDSVIVNKDSVRPEAIQYINERVTSPYRILEEKYTGHDKHPRGVFWIKGLHH
jgi:hypothetical protein